MLHSDTIRRAAAILTGVALGAGLLSCRASLPLGVQTTYVIRDIDSDTESRIERAFERDGLYGFRVLRRSAEGGAFEFQLADVADMDAFRDVAVRIREVSHRAMVPVVLQGATITFASVQGAGSAQIQVTGTATPGAEVLVDAGGPIVHERVGADGRWSAWVRRSPLLAARGGWIYGAIRKGAVRQYLKMNVLDTGSSARIRREDLPLDSPLRRE